MKNHYISSTVFLLLFLLGSVLQAQDRIYFRDGEVLDDVRVDTIVGSQIIFFEKKEDAEVRRTALTNNVKRVMYANGSHQDFMELYEDPTLYTNQRKRGLKVHLLSPLLGHSHFSYEQNMRPGRGIEYSLGIIGLGNNFDAGFIRQFSSTEERVQHDQIGFHLGVGYKFYTKPVIRDIGRRYKHLLAGWYVMPKVILGYYKRNEIEYVEANFTFENEIVRKKKVFATGMFYVGKQLVIAGSILLDLNLGVGVGYSTNSEEAEHHYVISMASKVIATGGGIKVGFVF